MLVATFNNRWRQAKVSEVQLCGFEAQYSNKNRKMYLAWNSFESPLFLTEKDPTSSRQIPLYLPFLTVKGAIIAHLRYRHRPKAIRTVRGSRALSSTQVDLALSSRC